MGALRTVVLGALALGGCGRFAFDPLGAAPDATLQSPDAATVDGRLVAVPDGTPRCVGYAVVADLPHRYRDGATTDWLAANAACMADGGYLWIPDDAVELAAVVTGTTWVGATDDAVEGTWLDSRGAAATYLPWLVDEPNNCNEVDCAEESCAEYVDGLGGFNDDACLSARPSICECDP